MSYLNRILQKPSYGWADDNGNLIIPSVKRLYIEAFKNINIFKSRKNWITLISWLMVVCMLPFFYLFIFRYFSLPLLAMFIVYSMMVMSTQATIWFHRYCTHKSFVFKNYFWMFITQNLVVKTFPEEIYVLSHHVHHAKSDEPGDPYNSKGGFFYCMLSDVNHQSIAKNLDEKDYQRAAGFLTHTGVVINSYKDYRKWGSVVSPLYTVSLWWCNWMFWGLVFYFTGGFAWVCTFFSAAMFWFIFVRAFNYTGHGKGETKHIDGIDFDRKNLSINQWRPGLLSGEWHNNHHLYPASARAGFLRFQIDFAWIYIYVMYKLGAITSYKDNKKDFIKKYMTDDSKS